MKILLALIPWVVFAVWLVIEKPEGRIIQGASLIAFLCTMVLIGKNNPEKKKRKNGGS